MNKSSVTISKPDPMFAIDYLVDHFADSRVVEYLGRGALTSECESISMVTALPRDPAQIGRPTVVETLALPGTG